MHDYSLQQPAAKPQKPHVAATLLRLLPLLAGEKSRIILATAAVLTNTALNLAAPVLIGQAVDRHVVTKQFNGVLAYAAILIAIYILALLTSYFQTTLMGTVGQNVLFNLRNSLFNKIQALPIAFFNQNKAGDLISRVNNDTDKLNQFLSQGLVQFAANAMAIAGTGIFIIAINWRLGLAALIPALLLLIFTRSLSPWIKKTNAQAMGKLGGLSAEIAESLENFKIIIAFERRDYFRRKFTEANDSNYRSAIRAGIANNTLTPAYGLASNTAQLIVIGYGLHLIADGLFTIGLLISYIAYVNRLYDPLRQMAHIWTSFQAALASWDRVNGILSLKSDLETVAAQPIADTDAAALEFSNVSFHYQPGKPILNGISFRLEPGKTYALVGPTGGGKTTTASLMARLYDPARGTVKLSGRDIRTFQPAERAAKIGFILQDPFLFTGTVRDNLLYGNKPYQACSSDELVRLIENAGLAQLLSRFESGLDAEVATGGGGLSLGQRQLIAFMRAVLRKPDILILDEATANIDTVTERLLQSILDGLPPQTTKIIIAHRLNTIAAADEIFFVNDGQVTPAGSLDNALDLLLHGHRKS